MKTNLLVFCLLVFSGSAISLEAAAREKTLKRVDDPVVMECKDLAPLFGSPVNHLALMALDTGDLKPVPFQIDQKKPDGNYAFNHGPEASVDPDPNLDDDDELVFMVKDTGDRIEDGRWPEGSEKIVEIEVIDPKNNEKGWVYLVRFSGKAPRSPDDYIRVEINQEKEHKRIISYEYTGGAPLDSTAVDYLAATTLPDGSSGLDVLDRLKIRGELIWPMDIAVPINADEMIKTEDKGYIDGPVRVLQLSEGWMEWMGLKIRGTGSSTVIYYVNHSIFPVYLEAPPDLPDFLKRLVPMVKINAFLDFNKNVYGSHPFSEANPYNDEVVLDGRMSAAEKNLDTTTPIEWIGGFGPQGAIVSRLILGPEAEGLKKLTYHLDDETIHDPTEDHPGITGVGYNLEGVTEGGEFQASGTFLTILYFKSDLSPKDVNRILDILDHPVEVTVRQVK